jgi:replicative DNA helicase
LTERVLPTCPEAETAVLGAMLLDPEVIGEVAHLLAPEDLHRPAFSQIFQVIVDCYEKGAAVDLLIVQEELRKRGWLESAGGAATLAELADAVPTSTRAIHHAQLVKEKAVLRRLIRTAGEILAEAYEAQEDAEAILDRSEQAIFGITRDHQAGEPSSIGEVLKETFDQLDRLHDRENRLTGIPTGFLDLDDLTCGLQDSEFIVVAGRPSMGKTSFALNVLERVAVGQGMPVALFSLEMAKRQITQNLLCIRAKVDAHKMRRGFLPESEWSKLTLAAGTLAEAKIYIDDTPSLNIMQLRARARRLKARHDIRLLVLDYIQMMDPGQGRQENRQQEITHISRSLKALARELGIPVVALSQLSRAVEGREGHRPRMSDLRESGAIEQDADVVMLLFREDYYKPDVKPGIVEVSIAKQRNGPTGTVEVAFLKNFMRFENLSARAASAEPATVPF